MLIFQNAEGVNG